MSLFKRFFKGIIHDRHPEDETPKVKEKPKPKYHGTVTPYPHFDASSDVSVLQSAIQSKDEDVIVAILVKRNNEQRQKIKAVYEASTGKNLVKVMKSVLRSDLEDVVLALLMPPAYFDAFLFRKATKGLGTDEDVLVEILATRSNKEIEEIKKVFKQEYQIELEEVIKRETHGDFNKALLAMLSAKRDETTEVNMELAKKDAKVLFEAGEGVGKADVSTFINILTTRSGPQLSKMFQHYATISDLTLPKALQLELKGDIEDCLIDIVKCAWNMPAFFAEKLHQAIEGHGTSERALNRVLVSRSEVDLQKIIEEYKAMFQRTLQEDIVNDTKGDYQKALLGLCGSY